MSSWDGDVLKAAGLFLHDTGAERAIKPVEGGRSMSLTRQVMDVLSHGDPQQAIVLLLRACGSGIRVYCAKCVREPDMVDDLVQEIFFKAQKHLHTFREEAAIETWLYAIAAHHCADYLRRRRTEQKWVDYWDGVPDVDALQIPTDEQIAYYQLLAHLKDCMAKLKPEVRMSLCLRYQEEMTFIQMVSICGKSEGALQMEVARAKLILLSCLESKGVKP